jgi:hypothetical protein
MPRTDPRIDAYIKKAPEFAKPILTHLRQLVHLGCPEVEETWKWSFPHFMHKGILCSMAAFKQHCSFGFWKGKLILGKNSKEDGMGQFGRITSLADLPSDKVLLAYIKEAVRLNETGTKLPRPARRTVKTELAVPPYFQVALQKKKQALKHFESFSYSHKKEYVEWLTEAKTEETRNRRMATALVWLAAGKSRNWKYANC